MLTLFPLKCGYWNWAVIMNMNGRGLVVVCKHVCLCVSLCLYSRTSSILGTPWSATLSTVNRFSILLRLKRTIGMSICGASNGVL